MFGKSANWWFGKNSVWAQSGLKAGVTSGASKGFGLTGVFDALGQFLGGKAKPEVQVDHGVSDTVKYGAIALVAYMVLK
jgi:hypothetical protein